MSGKSNKPRQQPSAIAQNRKARHDYTIDDTFEAGLVLEGWEVKSIRAGKVQLRDAYVQFKNGEAFLFGVQISPLASASTATRLPLRPLSSWRATGSRRMKLAKSGSKAPSRDSKASALSPLRVASWRRSSRL